MRKDKTYTIARCAAGCAFHSTVGGNCRFCGGPLAAPVTATREQARDILLHVSDGEYDRGKAATLAWLKARTS